MLPYVADISCQTQSYLARLIANLRAGQKIWLVQPVDSVPGVPSLGDEVLLGSNDAKVVSMRSIWFQGTSVMP